MRYTFPHLTPYPQILRRSLKLICFPPDIAIILKRPERSLFCCGSGPRQVSIGFITKLEKLSESQMNLTSTQVEELLELSSRLPHSWDFRRSIGMR